MQIFISFFILPMYIVCAGLSEWELLSVTQFSELRSEERVSAKMMQRHEQERQMKEKIQRAEERCHMAEERAHEAEQQLGVMTQRAQQAETRADELQRSLHKVKQRKHMGLVGQELEQERHRTREKAQQGEEVVARADKTQQEWLTIQPQADAIKQTGWWGRVQELYSA